MCRKCVGVRGIAGGLQGKRGWKGRVGVSTGGLSRVKKNNLEAVRRTN